jgi:hypothetical protein
MLELLKHSLRMPGLVVKNRAYLNELQLRKLNSYRYRKPPWVTEVQTQVTLDSVGQALLAVGSHSEDTVGQQHSPRPG